MLILFNMSNAKNWTQLLDDEDLTFLKRFVIASGSLKELAQAYGVSYPTVRLRLDRLIAKVKVYDSQQSMSDFEKSIRGMHADGRLDLATMKAILAAHKKELEAPHAKPAADRRPAAD
jgi:hypothetical protein